MSGSRNFLGESPAERKVRRRKVLIDAALDLVQEGGLAAIGVRSVSKQANLSVRYFYESFAGVDELVILMLQDVYSELMTNGMVALHAADGALVQPLDDSEILSRFNHGLRAALAVVLNDIRKVALIAAANSDSGAIGQELRKMVLMVADAISTDPGAKDAGIDHAWALFVAGGIVEVTLAYVSGGVTFDSEELASRLAQMCFGSLKKSCNTIS